MTAASPQVWDILYTVSRYLFPFLAVCLVLLVLLYILSESHARRDSVRSLPGAGTVGELIVLSGGRNLDVNTWFPVPREGVLGSVRSCDLVIPCPGVRSRHLDFSWEDGLGLLIRPCTGCEVQINGMAVDCRTNASAVPLTHGSVLQVGSAVLRLHLFAALDNTSAPVQPEAVPIPDVPLQPPAPVSDHVFYSPDSMQFVPPGPVLPAQEAPASGKEIPSLHDEPVPASPRRSDRWKEDLGE